MYITKSEMDESLRRLRTRLDGDILDRAITMLIQGHEVVPDGDPRASIRPAQATQPATTQKETRVVTNDLTTEEGREAEIDRLLAMGRTLQEAQQNVADRVDRAESKRIAGEMMQQRIDSLASMSQRDVRNIADDPDEPAPLRKAAAEYVTQWDYESEVQSASAIPADVLADIDSIVQKQTEFARVTRDGEYSADRHRALLTEAAQKKADAAADIVRLRGPKPYEAPPVFDSLRDKLEYGFQQLAEQQAAEAPAEAEGSESDGAE